MVRLACILCLLVSLPLSARAQDGVALTLGLGGVLEPGYFGSDDYELGPTGKLGFDYVRLGPISFGSPDPDLAPEGFSIGGAFNIVGAREAADYPELAGLNDIDASLELGVALRYDAPAWRAFGELRYGVTGHEAFVGEIGVDAIARPNDRLTLNAGPRFVIGSDDYASTYFGVTAAEAGASAFPAYDADGGLISAGVEIGMTYRLGNDWGLEGTIGYSRLMGDAADSPITQQGSRTQGSASLMLTRRISFGF